MRLTVKCPFSPDEHAQLMPPPGVPLGRLTGEHQEHITAAQVNGAFVEKWQTHVPAPDDRVTLFVEPRELISGAALLAALITAVISTAISIGLQYLLRALVPTKSQTEGKPEQVYGIAGQTNTTAQGTPKLICYGERRVYGHILSTFVGVANDEKSMSFGILYFMGEGEVQGMTQPQIDDVDVSQFPGVQSFPRLGGADNATLIHPDFDFLSQVWADGRQLPIGQPIVYQTKHAKCHSAFLILYTPFLHTDTGDFAFMTYTVEIAPVATNSYIHHLGPLTWGADSISPRFRIVPVIFPTEGHWLVRITVHDTGNAQETPPTLFSVRELQTGSQLYPDCALLAFTGIASSQIQSFDSMRGSALVQGRKVKIWNGTSFTTAYTRERAWIVRDLLTEQRVGLGPWIDESFFDDDAALAVQNSWNNEPFVGAGFSSDWCDVLINDRRPAWDWVKTLLSEGRAAAIPSDGKLKIVVDRPGSPGLLYSMPGNIIEGSLVHTLGNGQGHPPNTIQMQFPDMADGYRPQLITVRAEGSESEPQRETSALTAFSLTTYPHAYWLARYHLLRQRLVQRTFQWSSPATAMVSEPLDKATLSYETPSFARGISGFLSTDSSQTRLVLDRLVTLAPATTYSVLVRFQASNVVETRTVATTAGTWGAVELTGALSVTPQRGDLWALGVLGTTLLPVVIEDVEMQGDGTYQISAAAYVEAIYDFPHGIDLPDQPTPTPEPPPPGPDPGAPGAPSAVVLQGAFDGAGVISLSWTATVLAEGDTLLQYEIYTSLDTIDNVQPGFALPTEPLGFTQLVAELFHGFFRVRAVGTLGGPGPFSNAVETAWT